MKIVDLYEMALKHYSTHGDFDDAIDYNSAGAAERGNTSWVRRADRALIKHKKHIEKMYNMFANTKYDYRFVVADMPDFGLVTTRLTIDSDFKELTPEKMVKHLGEDYPDVLAELQKDNSDTITFLVGRNLYYNEFHIMKPWIFAHKIAHTILDRNPNKDPVVAKINKYFAKFMAIDAGLHFNDIGSSASFRNKEVLDNEEALVELMTRYIVFNDCGLKFNPAKVQNPDKVQHAVDVYAELLESYFDECLQKMVGKIFVLST